MLDTGNCAIILDLSKEDEFDCPNIENNSSTSDAPMFDVVALFDKFSLNAVEITLSFVAVYLFMVII